MYPGRNIVLVGRLTSGDEATESKKQAMISRGRARAADFGQAGGGGRRFFATAWGLLTSEPNRLFRLLKSTSEPQRVCCRFIQLSGLPSSSPSFPVLRLAQCSIARLQCTTPYISFFNQSTRVLSLSVLTPSMPSRAFSTPSSVPYRSPSNSETRSSAERYQSGFRGGRVREAEVMRAWREVMWRDCSAQKGRG